MIFAAILSGGIGTRLNAGVPKQFFKINDKPLLAYCIEQFVKVDEFDRIIVSSPKQFIDETQTLIDNYFDDDRLVVIEGGKTRNGTILNSIDYALENGANNDSVMVSHDAARIFVPTKLIKDSIRYAKEYGAASPIIPAVDVIFESRIAGELSDIPKRKYLFHSQTPQSFNIHEFLNIYQDLSDDEIGLLDEAMMLFYLRDKKVFLFEGDPSNFKITCPFDLKIAEAAINDSNHVH